MALKGTGEHSPLRITALKIDIFSVKIFQSPLSHYLEAGLADKVPAKVVPLGTRRKAAILGSSDLPDMGAFFGPNPLKPVLETCIGLLATSEHHTQVDCASSRVRFHKDTDNLSVGG